MKKMTNINVARINATRNLFASLPIEFTTQQFEDARRAEALANAVAAGHSHNFRWLDAEFKPYSLQNLREDGFVVIARVETFPKEVNVEWGEVVDRYKTDEVLFSGPLMKCFDFRNEDYRNRSVNFLPDRLATIEAKRNYYKVDFDALNAYLENLL